MLNNDAVTEFSIFVIDTVLRLVLKSVASILVNLGCGRKELHDTLLSPLGSTAIPFWDKTAVSLSAGDCVYLYSSSPN